jgi:ubiquinone/menaquinone biosynthesis C-methylase UbiE
MRNKLYQWVIGDATDCCYRSCLNYFYRNAVILDVGIGNGVMVKNYHVAIKEKCLKIIGLDIDTTYVHHCRGLLEDYDLSDHIKVLEQPVENFRPHRGRSFDFILFSMSFMLLEDQEGVLRRVSKWLKPGGEVVFFQTMFKSRNRLIEEIKPRLKHFTTIEFGEVTYEDDFYALLERQNFRVQTDRCIKRTWYKGSYRLIAARPVELN